jgi:hypothetical protein
MLLAGLAANYTPEEIEDYLKSGGQGKTVNQRELFILRVFAAAWSAGRHHLIVALTPKQNQLVFESFYRFVYVVWTDPEEFGKNLSGPLTWDRYKMLLNRINWDRYDQFINNVLERMGDYDPLAEAFVTSGTEDRSKYGIKLGDGIAHHLFGVSEDRIDPRASILCHGLFTSEATAFSKALEGLRITSDPQAEAHTLIIPESILADMILTCPDCGEKNRVPYGQRRDAVCGRCHRQL